MNSINKFSLCALVLFSFMLGMTIAYCDIAIKEPNLHYAIEHRALNYTKKDCYTQSDVELIVFGKVLDYDKK